MSGREGGKLCLLFSACYLGRKQVTTKMERFNQMVPRPASARGDIGDWNWATCQSRLNFFRETETHVGLVTVRPPTPARRNRRSLCTLDALFPPRAIRVVQSPSYRTVPSPSAGSELRGDASRSHAAVSNASRRTAFPDAIPTNAGEPDPVDVAIQCTRHGSR